MVKDMTLNEKYRIHNKTKSNKSMVIYLLIVVIFVFSNSWARYISDADLSFGVGIANWSIKVNNVQITQDTQKIYDKIDIEIVENDAQDGMIKSGQSGYFDITINPEYAEVSLDYSIEVDTSDLPSQIELVGYSINDFSTRNPMPENNLLDGNILLAGKINLTNLDTKVYRIYWQWDDENYVTEEKDYKLIANIEIEQIVE